MSENITNQIIAHAGTPFVISAANLALMFAVLTVLLIGVRFGRVKNRDSLRKHRYVMTAAIVLFNIGIVSVMLPAFWNFYTDPDVELFSTLSIATVAHMVVGILAEIVGITFALNLLPKKMRPWMRTATLLWVAALAVGIAVFTLMLM